MLELSRAGELWRMSYGGDTLNTALHLARFGVATAYLTAVGDDPFSQDLLKAWTDQGLDTSFIEVAPGRCTGLYAIFVDPQGERTFSYWRGESPARNLFDPPGAGAEAQAALGEGLLYFSLISLAVLPPEGRARLLALAKAVKAQGGRVAFDGNYRPRLWRSQDEALSVRNQALSLCDLALPTLDDEEALTGLRGDAQVLDDLRRQGDFAIALKTGPRGCLDRHGVAHPPRRRVAPVDTSGAGDAFNAGFICAWLQGRSFSDCAAAGAELAAWVLERPGAIPAKDDAAPY